MAGAARGGLSAAAFSADGYIINQDETAAVQYGALSSDNNGCGWIAAYNLMRALGMKPQVEEVRQGMAEGLMLGGSLGTGPRHLTHYLQGQGAAVRLFSLFKSGVQGTRLNAPGAILYWAGPWLHYVAFAPTGKAAGGKPLLRFFNAIYGDAEHLSTMDDFLAKHVKFPFVFLVLAQTT